MAYANLATNPKRLETELTNITRLHFCSLRFLCIERSFIYFISFLFISEFFPLFVCFDILWENATAHATGTQIVRAKMRSLDAIFCRGNKSGSRSLFRFCHRKNFATEDIYCPRFALVKKNWARVVGKSNDVTKIQTTKLSILLRFYFHDGLEQLKLIFIHIFASKGFLVLW